jgi:integrase
MAQYLSDSIVKRLPLPAHHDVTTKDTLVRGFGIRVTAAGARSFTLNYRRKADGRQRRLTIGTFPDWTTVQAREEAKRLKRAIDNGGDPVGEQEGIRTAPTIADLCQRFIADYLPRKRATTQRVYGQQIAADILPALGEAKVAAVSHGDVDQWHHRLSKRGPTHANRTLAVLSKMFSLAVRWQMRPDNPCRGIERNQEHKRQRYLTAEEMTRLATALTELSDQNAANAVRLLLLTGARRGELLAARWADFDLKAGSWTKPGASTKQKVEHRVPLSAPACQLLHEMRVQAGDKAVYLFPARNGGHRSHIDSAWIALRIAAGVPDLRLHDLRHSFASMLASSGFSLPLIGTLLGHSTPVTTARYAHLFDSVQRTAVERVGALVKHGESAEIVPLGGKVSKA